MRNLEDRQKIIGQATINYVRQLKAAGVKTSGQFVYTFTDVTDRKLIKVTVEEL